MNLYGIINCDSVKKAKKWLQENGHTYTFYNFKENKPTKKMISAWCKNLGWNNVLNKKSTNWRQVSNTIKETINEEKAIEIMCDNPLLIKRPICEKSDVTLSGFKREKWEKVL